MFSQIHSGNFNLLNEPRWLSDGNKLRAVLDTVPLQTTDELPAWIFVTIPTWLGLVDYDFNSNNCAQGKQVLVKQSKISSKIYRFPFSAI